MEIRYYKHFSNSLGRAMEFKVYGHRGMPVLFIPCQAGSFVDFENFKMSDYWAKWIDAGQVTVYSCDVIDGETYADVDGAPRSRIELHEKWYPYIVDDLVPYIKHRSGERNWHDEPIMTFGCSMGAMHAANLFFRRPDLFGSVFAISGLYDSEGFFGNYMDDLLYQNTPCRYLANMSPDHYYINMYNERKMIIVVGQGAWEDELKASTANLKRVCESKGIHAQIDFWGHDVNHDWPWWYKMVEYYVPQLL